MRGVILTPDQRLRVFVSSTMEELAEERRAARRAVEQLHLAPVMFELGARPHPPRSPGLVVAAAGGASRPAARRRTSRLGDVHYTEVWTKAVI